MPADGAIMMFLGGILHAGEAEGVSAGQGAGLPEGVIADRTIEFLYLTLHQV